MGKFKVSSAKYIIYALVDPNTRFVRYVGQTRKTLAERLHGHLFPGRARASQSVYKWIRSLHPQQPIIVTLQEVEDHRIRQRGKWCSAVAAAEVKWMKRFERYILNSINRDCRTYKSLINP